MNSKRKTYTILIIIFLVLICVLLIIGKLVPKKAPSNEIQPGKTTTDKFLQQQKPYLTTTQNNETQYYTGDQNSNRNETYVSKNGVISHSIQRDQTKWLSQNLSEYVTKYGKPDFERFGPWYLSGGYMSYIFLKEGLIVIAHPQIKTVTEVWNISQNLTQTEFDVQFGQTFTTAPPAFPQEH